MIAGFESYSLMQLVGFGLALALSGVITGLLAGVFGVGGGTVIVPVLYQLFSIMGVSEEVRMHMAVGTSLAVIIPTSIQSFRTHLAKGAVLVEALKSWAVPVVAGVVAGSVIAAYAPALLLKLVFIAIAGINIAKLLMGAGGMNFGTGLPSAPVHKLYGFAVGIGSSLMGIGGGLLSSMYLTLFGQPIHRAIATGAGVGVLISIPGAIGYMLAGLPKASLMPPLSVGYVSLVGVALIAPLSSLFAPMGARLAHRLPKRKLEIAFTVFLAFVCLRFVWSLV